MMRKSFASFCVVLLLAACGTNTEQIEKTKIVALTPVVSAADATVLEYPGKVHAAEDISLGFKVSGAIERYAVQEGQYVRAGELLVEMDDVDYRTQLKATEAEYAQIKGDCDRIIALYNDSATTKSNYDKAVYGLEQISAKLENHRNQLNYTKITAPFSGYVQKKLFGEHEIVSAGLPVISMISDGSLEVEINIPAAEYVHRKTFSDYSCVFDIFPGEKYGLKLLSISPKANANQLYLVRLALEGGHKNQPSAGMSTTVSIVCDMSEANEFLVPTTCIKNDGEKATVYVYDATKGILNEKLVAVKNLKSDGTAVIESADLKVGDRIVVSGVHHVGDGEAVKPLPEPTKTNVGGLL